MIILKKKLLVIACMHAITHEWQGLQFTHACAHVCWCVCVCVCVCVCMHAHVTSIKCFLTLKCIDYFIAALSRKTRSRIRCQT